MINRPKEKDMKDLDQSDVERDAENMRDEYIADLAENLDGADLVTVIALIADSQGLTFKQALDRSLLVREIIASTQSSPEVADGTLHLIADAL